MEELLKKKMEEIKMTGAMQERILQNCLKDSEKERTSMRMTEKNNNKRWFQKPMAVAVALVLCLTVGGVTAFAAGGKGFFKDITDWRGAVTGTTYEQATEEIDVSVTEEAGVLKVEAIFLEAEKAPYSELEELAVGTYQLIDANGKTAAKGDTGEAVPVQDGQAVLMLDMEKLPEGQYTLRIQSIIGSKKAEQPLSINGNWECEFSVK